MGTIKGTIHSIGEVQNITETFSKKEFVIKVEGGNPDYPQYRQLECQKDNVAKLNGFNVGDVVEVEYNENGRLWTNPEGVEKCFNTDSIWKLIKSETPQDNEPF